MYKCFYDFFVDNFYLFLNKNDKNICIRLNKTTLALTLFLVDISQLVSFNFERNHKLMLKFYVKNYYLLLIN